MRPELREKKLLYHYCAFGNGISIDDIYTESSVYDGQKYTRFYIGGLDSYVQVIGINNVEFADGSKLTFDEFKSAVKPASDLA